MLQPSSYLMSYKTLRRATLEARQRYNKFADEISQKMLHNLQPKLLFDI